MLSFLRRLTNWELTVQQKCTLFLMGIVVLHVGGLIWIILADWPSNEISGWRF